MTSLKVARGLLGVLELHFGSAVVSQFCYSGIRDTLLMPSYVSPTKMNRKENSINIILLMHF